MASTERKQRESGFTLLETAISLSVFTLLMASIFALSVEVSGFVGLSDSDFSMQLQGNRALSRLTEVLRKSGRVEIAGVAYPRVISGGAALEFRALEDLDGNGFAFAEADGELEWDPQVYTIKVDADESLGVFAGTTLVHLLGRNVQDLSFATIAEDNTLHLKEIKVSFETLKEVGDGQSVKYDVDASIHMRN